MNPGGARRVRLHVVTDDDVLSRPGWLERAVSVMDAGQGELALHLRGPKLPGAAVNRLASRLLAPADRSGTPLVINDRVDVALAAGVRVVHLGRRSLPPRSVRRLAGGDGAAGSGGLEVGVSCHTVDDVETACSEGADYLFMGSVYATASHPGRAAVGLVGLKAAVAAAGAVPVIGIGGITPERIAEVVAAGAYGAAAIRGIWDAGRPDRAVSKYLSALSEARRE